MKLPVVKKEGKMSVEEAIAKRRSRRSFKGDALTLEEVGQLLWATQGISNERGLRTVPSAGATFPLEAYLVAGNVKDLKAGLYRYEPQKHELLLVKGGDLRKDVCAAALGQRMIEEAPATIVIAAVYERTAGRYKERATRYVHMEVGHAGQNIYLQCEALGLGTCAIGAFHDAKLKEVLGIKEEPLYLMPVGRIK
ncbi:MAG: SagB/ThcOx family dehydrogenase [Planctomycetota bacterium]|nr:SagB/ThcOx family dehydrogenase [Planctomycetota bacterium]